MVVSIRGRVEVNDQRQTNSKVAMFIMIHGSFVASMPTSDCSFLFQKIAF